MQALCALLLNFASDNPEARDVVRLTMSEFFKNLTAAALNEKDFTQQAEFVALHRLSILLYKYFEVMNLKSIANAQTKALKLREELNKYMVDKSNEIKKAKVVDVNDYSPSVPGHLPSNETIKDTNAQIDKETLETANCYIRMNRTYKGRVPRDRRRRGGGQRGQGLNSTLKKIAKDPMTKPLIRTDAQHLPGLYAKATSKIKNPKFKKVLEPEAAKKLVNKLHEKGIAE